MSCQIPVLVQTPAHSQIGGPLTYASEVQHASIVQVVYEGDADEDFQEFFIGSIEEKPEGVLVASPTSPLGSALLGHAVGDLVEYEAPSGVLRIKIVGLR